VKYVEHDLQNGAYVSRLNVRGSEPAILIAIPKDGVQAHVTVFGSLITRMNVDVAELQAIAMQFEDAAQELANRLMLPEKTVIDFQDEAIRRGKMEDPDAAEEEEEVEE